MISVFINMFKTVDNEEGFGRVQHVRSLGLTGQRMLDSSATSSGPWGPFVA